MTNSVKRCFATAMMLLITVNVSAQTSEPILNATYKQATKPVLKTAGFAGQSQIADIQAKPRTILWLGDMEHATDLSLQTGRPILLHFEQPNCKGSLYAHQSTFIHPEFIQVIYDHFIPVRINVLAKPELGKKFKITQTPTDIVLDAEGEIIYRGITEPNAVSYATKLATFATVSNDSEQTIDIDVGFEVDTVDFENPSLSDGVIAPANYPQGQQAQPNYRPQNQPYQNQPYQNQPYQEQQYQLPQQNQAARQVPNQMPTQTQPRANYPQPQQQYNQHPPVQQVPLPQSGQALPSTYPLAQAPTQSVPPQPQQQMHQPPIEKQLQPPVVDIPPAIKSQPKLGLNGYCPVSLSDLNNTGAKWVKGDPKYGIIHRGRLYLFAGQHQLDVFKKFPERLAPVISGYDPVIFTDHHQLIDGARELGVSYKGQVYLFQSKQSLQRFWTAPDRYAANANAAMQRTR